MEKKIYSAYNQINQDFDVVAMTRTEIQSFKNKKHFLVLLDKKDHKPPRDRIPKWFKEYAEKTDARLDKIEAKLNSDEPPKWFKEFAEKQEAFNKAILERLDKHDELFRQHGWIK